MYLWKWRRERKYLKANYDWCQRYKYKKAKQEPGMILRYSREKKMVKIIGNKNRFAIEYQQTTSGRGFCRIWINGKPFGNFKDEVYLLPVYHSLRRAKQFSKENKMIKLLIDNKNILGIKHKLFFDDKYAEDALVGLPENFDDFVDRVFRFNGDVYICWILIDNPYFAYESEYDKEPHIGIIKESEYLNVLDNYQRDINSCIGA